MSDNVIDYSAFMLTGRTLNVIILYVKLKTKSVLPRFSIKTAKIKFFMLFANIDEGESNGFYRKLN